MDKTVEFLEKHVQWLAVGLGGLFLAWALYAYVLVSPVEVVTAGQGTVDPGTVDDTVNKSFAKPLNDDMSNTAAVEAPPTSRQNPQTEFATLLSAPPVPPADLPVIAMNAPRSDATVGGDDRRIDGEVVMVEALPKVPPAPIVETMPRRAYVGPAVTAANAAAPPPPPAQPAANGEAAPPPGRDTSYVRVTYTIPVDAIAANFKDAKVPQTLTTSVTAVKLMRQEKLPDGTWGPATEVALPKTGVAHQTLPPENAETAVYTTFRTWSDSQTGQADLLRPTFYPVIYGEGPWDPSMEDQMPSYDPDAERKAKQAKYKEEQDKKRQANPPRPSQPRMPRGGVNPGGMPPMNRYGVNDAERPTKAGGVFDTQAAPPSPDDVPASPAPAPPAQQPVAPGAGLPPADVIASPSFVPAQATPFSAWAYDETVIEGHVYRYQMLYALRNPTFLSNITKPAELSKTFTMWSTLQDNGWGPEVTVKPTAEYYLNSTNWRSDRIPGFVTIDVYKWANGKWHSQSFKVSPGDGVGEETKGVDFATGTTVVDLRYDSRAGSNGSGRPYVLLLTPGGQLLEREPTADRNNPNMLRIKGVIASGQNPVPGQPGTSPMGVPGGGAMPPMYPGGMPPMYPGAGGTTPRYPGAGGTPPINPGAGGPPPVNPGAGAPPR